LLPAAIFYDSARPFVRRFDSSAQFRQTLRALHPARIATVLKKLQSSFREPCSAGSRRVDAPERQVHRSGKLIVMTTASPDLADMVSSAISTNPYLAGRKLRFEAEAGRVVLRGTVSTFFQKQMAQEALRRIDGIQEIENQLEVSWL